MHKKVFILTVFLIAGITNAKTQTAGEVILKITPDSIAFTALLKKEGKKIKQFAFNAKEQIVCIKYDTTKLTNESFFNLFPGYSVAIVNDVNTKPAEDSFRVEDVKIVESRPKNNKYNLELDQFLNRIGEVSDGCEIFKDFKVFEEKEMHPRNKDLYLMVKAISDFNEKIKSVEQADETIRYVNKSIGVNGLPQSTIKELAELNQQVKNNIAEMGQLNDLIKSYATTEKGMLYFLLSEPQKQFYRDLVISYQKLYDVYN